VVTGGAPVSDAGTPVAPLLQVAPELTVAGPMPAALTTDDSERRP
jgi:hypothetical protein